MHEGWREDLIVWLRRPYFDLGAADESAPVVAHGPTIAYQRRAASCKLTLERSPGPNYRYSLAREAGTPWAALQAPCELAEERRTPEWADLCARVDAYRGLSLADRVDVLGVLVSLSFHDLVLELTATEKRLGLHDEVEAALLGIRALVRYFAYQPDLRGYEPEDFTALSEETPLMSLPGYAATLLLMIYWAKFRRDLELAKRCRQTAERRREAWIGRFSAFEESIRHSQFLRGVSLVPFLAGARDQVTEELDQAEVYARAAVPRDRTEEILFKDNLCSVLETRMREALWKRDLDQAEEYIRGAVELDPWDPKLRMEVAEVLAKRGRLAAAAQTYLEAAEAGPPGTAISFFLAGHCLEACGDLEAARSAYLRAVRVDPYGLSPLQGLARTARITGHLPLHAWASSQLETLGEDANTEPMPAATAEARRAEAASLVGGT